MSKRRISKKTKLYAGLGVLALVGFYAYQKRNAPGGAFANLLGKQPVAVAAKSGATAPALASPGRTAEEARGDALYAAWRDETDPKRKGEAMLAWKSAVPDGAPRAANERQYNLARRA